MAGPSENSHVLFILSSVRIQALVSASQSLCLQPQEQGLYVAAR